MRKIKDRILLGVFVSLIAATPGRIINAYEYKHKLTNVKYGQLAANLLVAPNQVDSFEGGIVGCAANKILTSTTGISITYLLSATGRDHAVLKANGITGLYWLTFFGLSERLGITHLSKKPGSSLYSLLDHLTFGTLCGLLIPWLGDDSIFPDGEKKE